MKKAIKVLKNQKDAKWNYNDETDIFYLSTGNSQTAISLEIGDGLIVYYDETKQEVIGVNLTGLLAKVLKKLGKDITSGEEEKRLTNEESKNAMNDAGSAAYGKQLFDHGGEA